MSTRVPDGQAAWRLVVALGADFILLPYCGRRLRQPAAETILPIVGDECAFNPAVSPRPAETGERASQDGEKCPKRPSHPLTGQDVPTLLIKDVQTARFKIIESRF